MKEKEQISAEESYVVKTFRKAIVSSSEWPDKDEFLDVVYWIRQILGVLLGFLWGVVPMQGVLGLALFFLVSSGVVYGYFQTFQCVDDEEFGGPSELLKEGLMASFAGFLVTWIITYSGLHYG